MKVLPSILLSLFLLSFGNSSALPISKESMNKIISDGEIRNLGLPESFFRGIYIEREEKIPNFPFYDENNKEIIIKNFRNNVVVMFFWSVWNMEARLLITEINYLSKYFKQREINNVVFVPVYLEYKDSEKAKTFYEENSIKSIPLYIDKEGKFLEHLKIVNLPTIFIIDKDGYIAARIDKYLPWYNLDIADYLIALTNRKW